MWRIDDRTYLSVPMAESGQTAGGRSSAGAMLRSLDAYHTYRYVLTTLSLPII